MTPPRKKSAFTVRAGHKFDSIKACDKVCFTVYGNETIKDLPWAPYVQSAVVFGRCHIVEDMSAAAELLRRLAAKYYPDEQAISEEIAHAVLSNTAFWDEDLTAAIPGFEASVSASLEAIRTKGARAAIDALAQ